MDYIFDRTKEDIEYAKGIINAFKTLYSNQDLSSEEYDRWLKEVSQLKGNFSHEDMKRILEGLYHIMKELNARGYMKDPYNPHNAVVHAIGYLVDEREVNYLLETLKNLRNIFYVHPNAPDVPLKLTHYEEVNDYEYNLHLIELLFSYLDECNKKRYSRTFRSGASFGLVLKGG